MVSDPLQVARISLLKSHPVETPRRRPLVPGVNEVRGNIDSNNLCPETGERNRRSAVSAAEVQNPQRRRYSERFDEYFPRSTH